MARRSAPGGSFHRAPTRIEPSASRHCHDNGPRVTPRRRGPPLHLIFIGDICFPQRSRQARLSALGPGRRTRRQGDAGQGTRDRLAPRGRGASCPNPGTPEPSGGEAFAVCTFVRLCLRRAVSRACEFAGTRVYTFHGWARRRLP